jgi:glucose-specific phosphotransferase system IIA component
VFFGRKKKDVIEEVFVATPIKGIAVPLEQIEDEAFASKSMGEGIAILPTEGKVFSPFDGTVAYILEKSKHAIVLEHQTGVQVLIHIGMNTVSLKGEGFKLHVSTGDKIKKGKLLIEFDIELIQERGYPIITPVIVPVGQEIVKKVDIVKEGNDEVLLNKDLLRIKI